MRVELRFLACAILAVFLIAHNTPAQEPTLSNPDPLVNIIEKIIDSTVDIETTLIVDGGPARLETDEVVFGELKIGNSGFILPAKYFKTENGDNKIKFGGSGAFVDTEGHILTAAHVVKADNDEAEFSSPFGSLKIKVVDYEYWVVLRGKNRQYSAEYVGACVGADYAMIQAKDINPNDYKIVSIGKPSELKIGDSVIAIGTPYGLSGTVTRGVVSQLHRRIEMNYYEDFIQTDAAINPGNSGGPLLNAKGEMVGINTAAIPGRSIGFAVSMDLIDLEAMRKGDIVTPWFGAEALLDQFPRRGKYKKPGIHDLSFLYEKTGLEDAQSLMTLADLSFYFRDGDPEKPVEFENKWAILYQVEGTSKATDRASPAKKAGLKKGDLIIKVGGVRIRDGMDLRLALRRVPIDGKPLEIRYLRITAGVAKEESCLIVLEKK